MTSEEASKFIGSIIQGLVGEMGRQNQGGSDNNGQGDNQDDASQAQMLLGGAGLIVPPRPPCLETLLTLPKGSLLMSPGNTGFNGNAQNQGMQNPTGIEAGSVLGYSHVSSANPNTNNSIGLSINGIANSFIDVMTSSVTPVAKVSSYVPLPPPLYGRTTSRSRPSRVLQDAGRVPPRMISLGNGLLNSLIEQATSHLFKLSPLVAQDLARECASCALAIRCRLLVGRLSRIWRETCTEIDSLQGSKGGNFTDTNSATALRIRRMRVRWISCIIRAMGRFGPAGVLAILKGVAEAGTPTKPVNFLKEVMDKENRTPLNKMSTLDIANLMTQAFETAVNPTTPAMKAVKVAQEKSKPAKPTKTSPFSRRVMFESGLSAASLRQRISAMRPRHV